VSFVGELGWELYVPAEAVETVHDLLVAAGAGLGLRHAGYHALDSLRLEKGYRHWPLDIGPLDTPIDGGLAFTVGWDKPAFIGRAALLAQREAPRRRRLVHLTLDDPDGLLYHGESLLRGGRVAGRVTSGAYGHHLGRATGIAVLEDPELLEDRRHRAGRLHGGRRGPRHPRDGEPAAVLRPRQRAPARMSERDR
jgi:4-methylaminobutanoate oxidase (formaldehyde-forming)